MRTNREDPKSAMKGSFGHNEAQKPSMTRVGDKKKSMAKKMVFEKAREAHRNAGPFKSAYDAVNSPTYSAMHKARKDMNK